MTEVKQSKELNFMDIKKEYSKYDEVIEYQLDEDTHLTFRPYFKNTELQEMVKKMNHIDEETIPNDLVWPFMLFHLIKTFTGLSEQLKGETLAEQLEEMNVIIDTEFEGRSLFKIIVEDMFLPEEIKKVNDLLHEGLAIANKLQNVAESSLLELEKLKLAQSEILNEGE